MNTTEAGNKCQPSAPVLSPREKKFPSSTRRNAKQNLLMCNKKQNTVYWITNLLLHAVIIRVVVPKGRPRDISQIMFQGIHQLA